MRLADLYDPTTSPWRAVAEMRVAREYHATTLLLPDGRVLTMAGAGTVGSPSGDMGVDAYSPPYLLRGPRPRIDGLSRTSMTNAFQMLRSIIRSLRRDGPHAPRS